MLTWFIIWFIKLYYINAIAVPDNSINRVKEDKPGSLKEKHAELKKVYQDVMKSYESIDQKTASRQGQEGLSRDFTYINCFVKFGLNYMKILL